MRHLPRRKYRFSRSAFIASNPEAIVVIFMAAMIFAFLMVNLT